MEIYKILYLSTEHLKPKTFREMVDHEYDVIVYNVEAYDCLYGCFVLAEDYDEFCNEPIPDDLKACLDFALEHDCAWIRFDGDFEPLPELPIYEQFESLEE